MSRVLAVRLDGAGDVLLTGPALRAVAASGAEVTVLTSNAGRPAAELLPGVSAVLPYDAPWVSAPYHRSFAGELQGLATRLRDAFDLAIIFTSYHQSALPAAMLCRIAGIERIVATSDDWPGTLLDVRHRRLGVDMDDDGLDGGGHEVEAGLRLAEAAGFRLPADDDAGLRIVELPPARAGIHPTGRFVVVHAGASVPARGIDTELATLIVRTLAARHHQVVLTGHPAEGPEADTLPTSVTDLRGHTDLHVLAQVLDAACAVVVGNTGPAHLAAAVGTPIVSLFAPVVPASRWRPWGVPQILLGDQDAACAFTRARSCPVPGHPCMAGVTGDAVADAVEDLLQLNPSRLQEDSCAS